MEVGRILPLAAPGGTGSGWAESPAGDAAPGQARGTSTSAPAPLAGSRADNTHEAATLQTLTRPQVTLVDPLRPAEIALPSQALAGSQFALPADQLVPVALIGLQVESPWAWPLPRPPYGTQAPVDARAPETPRDDTGTDDRARSDDAPAEDDADGSSDADAADGAERARSANPEIVDPLTAAWCEPLTAALRTMLDAADPPLALRAAAEQWQRGRCVLLACPQGVDAAGPAWAFVLWPRGRAMVPRQLQLFGLQVAARLQWSRLPPAAPWIQVRVVKEHHPRRGRQLVALDTSAVVPCDVQLGPVLARTPRPCEVHLRIDAARRYWGAMGAQWSACLVVCAWPLAGAAAPDIVERTC